MPSTYLALNICRSTENLVVEWGVLWHLVGVADEKLSPAWGTGLG